MRLSPFHLLAGALLFTVVARAQRAPVGEDIAVRAGIDDAEMARRTRDPIYGNDASKHRRVFFLARVMEEKNGTNLVKPVDAVAIAKDVSKLLIAQGFQAVEPGQKPEMVITVKYGRGFLPNPYTDTDGDKLVDNLSNSDIVSVWHPHEHLVGLEEKRQLAGMEKLVIQVRAWEYPPPKDPKEKEKLLWMTTVYIADPDHVDLNLVADRMLAKAAPYFDRHIGREDEVVIRAVPDGHVNVGAPEVVEPVSPKSQ